MSAPFAPGDVVVCVDASPARIAMSDKGKQLVARYCKVDAVYRVEAVRLSLGRRPGKLCLKFVGIDSEPYAGFSASRFRKIDDEVSEDFRQQLKSLSKPKERV
jgi:hypothetical protein